MTSVGVVVRGLQLEAGWGRQRGCWLCWGGDTAAGRRRWKRWRWDSWVSQDAATLIDSGLWVWRGKSDEVRGVDGRAKGGGLFCRLGLEDEWKWGNDDGWFGRVWGSCGRERLMWVWRQWRSGAEMARGRKKKKIRSGGRNCFGWRWILGLDFPLFFVFFFQNCPPSWWVLKATIYRQNVAWASKLVPQFYFIFVNFDFS